MLQLRRSSARSRAPAFRRASRLWRLASPPLDPALDPVAKPGVKPTLPRFQNHNQPQHPTTVKRAYDATHKTAATPAAKGETRVEKLEHEIERLTFEVEAWRKKAEADGSLFVTATA